MGSLAPVIDKNAPRDTEAEASAKSNFMKILARKKPELKALISAFRKNEDTKAVADRKADLPRNRDFPLVMLLSIPVNDLVLVGVGAAALGAAVISIGIATGNAGAQAYAAEMLGAKIAADRTWSIIGVDGVFAILSSALVIVGEVCKRFG